MLKKCEVGMLAIVLSFICGIASARELKAVRATGSFKIDGKLDEADWKSAPVCGPLTHLKKSPKNKPIPAKLQTTFKVLYDNNGVYFGIRANETNVSKIKKAVKKEIDSSLWSGDDVEVFIDTNQDRTEYYQFATGPGGAKSDLYFIEAGNTGSAGYNPEWKAEAFIGKDFYTVEMFMPYAAFYKQRLIPGPQNWLISVCRQRLAGKEFRHTRLTNSSKGGFHDVKTMIPVTGLDIPKTVAFIELATFAVTTDEKDGVLLCSTDFQTQSFDGVKREVKITVSTKSGTVSKKVQFSSSRAHVTLPPVKVEKEGKTIFDVKVEDASTGNLLYTNRFVRNVKYSPLVVKLLAPAYRNNIYATENIDTIKANAAINLPAKSYKGGKITAVLKDANGAD
ncbi:MAG: hypothetical protein KAG97_05580, partial [Victivallales bacterium]|nr:hypothetical protein [Victivallales bacterium]